MLKAVGATITQVCRISFFRLLTPHLIKTQMFSDKRDVVEFEFSEHPACCICRGKSNQATQSSGNWFALDEKLTKSRSKCKARAKQTREPRTTPFMWSVLAQQEKLAPRVCGLLRSRARTNSKPSILRWVEKRLGAPKPQ